MKKTFTFIILIVPFIQLCAQLSMIKSENFLPKYGENFEYYLNYIGLTNENQFYKGEANYIKHKKFKDCIYYQANFETNKVDVISLKEYKILNEIVVDNFLKVYTYEQLSIKDNKKIVNINLLTFDKITNKPEIKNIHQFQYGQDKFNCKIRIFSSLSPDKQKIGFLLLVYDNNNNLYNIQCATFNNLEELIWSQNIDNPDPSLLNKFEMFSITNEGMINIVISKFNKFVSPFYIKKHIIYSLFESVFSQKIIETYAEEVVSSFIKVLSNGDLIFLDQLNLNKKSTNGYELIKYNLKNNTVVRDYIPLPNNQELNIYEYNYKKNIDEYYFDFVDIHENANKEIYLIFRDLNLTSTMLNYKYFTRNIYIHKLTEDFSEHNTLGIPHSISFQTSDTSREFTGMINIYSYCINNDIYLVYNENLDNFKNQNNKIWKINEDVFGEKNRIALTHIDHQLNFETICSTENLYPIVTLKQTLYNSENKIYFITDKHAIGFFEF